LVRFSLGRKENELAQEGETFNWEKWVRFFTSDRLVAQKGTLVRSMNKLCDLVPDSKLILYE